MFFVILKTRVIEKYIFFGIQIIVVETHNIKNNLGRYYYYQKERISEKRAMLTPGDKKARLNDKSITQNQPRLGKSKISSVFLRVE